MKEFERIREEQGRKYYRREAGAETIDRIYPLNLR
jgi:hypothetical protein